MSAFRFFITWKIRFDQDCCSQIVSKWSGASRRRVNIEIVRDGQLVAKRTSPLAVPDSSGRIRVLLQSERQPGSYVLKVSVPLKSGTLERSIVYIVYTVAPTAPGGDS